MKTSQSIPSTHISIHELLMMVLCRGGKCGRQSHLPESGRQGAILDAKRGVQQLILGLCLRTLRSSLDLQPSTGQVSQEEVSRAKKDMCACDCYEADTSLLFSHHT